MPGDVPHLPGNVPFVVKFNLTPVVSQKSSNSSNFE